jgi:hypothetical protein
MLDYAYLHNYVKYINNYFDYIFKAHIHLIICKIKSICYFKGKKNRIMCIEEHKAKKLIKSIFLSQNNFWLQKKTNIHCKVKKNYNAKSGLTPTICS